MRSRPHLRTCVRPRARARARIEDAALLSRVPSLCNDERKGRVFIRRDEMHSEFARGEKSRRSRSLNGRLDGLARWFMEPERENKVSRLSTAARKNPVSAS